jgi:hypothetical protein
MIDSITDEEIPPERVATIKAGTDSYPVDIKTLYQHYAKSGNPQPINPYTTLPLDTELCNRVLTYGKSLEIEMWFIRGHRRLSIVSKTSCRLGWFLAEYYRLTGKMATAEFDGQSVYSHLAYMVTAPRSKVMLSKPPTRSCKMYDLTLLYDYHETYPGDWFQPFDDLLFECSGFALLHVKRIKLDVYQALGSANPELIVDNPEDDFYWTLCQKIDLVLPYLQSYSFVVRLYQRLTQITTRSIFAKARTDKLLALALTLIDIIVDNCKPTIIRDLYVKGCKFPPIQLLLDAYLTDLSSARLVKSLEVTNTFHQSYVLGASKPTLLQAFAQPLSMFDYMRKDPLQIFANPVHLQYFNQLAPTALLRKYLNWETVTHSLSTIHKLIHHLRGSTDSCWAAIHLLDI